MGASAQKMSSLKDYYNVIIEFDLCAKQFKRLSIGLLVLTRERLNFSKCECLLMFYILRHNRNTMLSNGKSISDSL